MTPTYRLICRSKIRRHKGLLHKRHLRHREKLHQQQKALHLLEKEVVVKVHKEGAVIIKIHGQSLIFMIPLKVLGIRRTREPLTIVATQRLEMVLKREVRARLEGRARLEQEKGEGLAKASYSRRIP